MIKTKRRLLLTIILIFTVLALCFLCSFYNNSVAKAQSIGNENEEIEPYGLVTQISITIGGDGDTIWASAHNDFTLGFSTVQVYVYLYSSLAYEEDYRNMKLESSAYIEDLNIGKSLKTTASIGGVQRYWRARVRYKLDKNDWKTKETSTYLVDKDGNRL